LGNKFLGLIEIVAKAAFAGQQEENGCDLGDHGQNQK